MLVGFSLLVLRFFCGSETGKLMTRCRTRPHQQLSPSRMACLWSEDFGFSAPPSSLLQAWATWARAVAVWDTSHPDLVISITAGRTDRRSASGGCATAPKRAKIVSSTMLEPRASRNSAMPPSHVVEGRMTIWGSNTSHHERPASHYRSLASLINTIMPRQNETWPDSDMV